MKILITKEMVHELYDKFMEYTETAEQHEFPILAFINMALDVTIEQLDKRIENQKEMRTMFRVVLRAIGEDYSEYKEET